MFEAFNTVTGKFLGADGQFTADRKDAALLTATELAVTRATFNNVGHNKVLDENEYVRKLVAERDALRLRVMALERQRESDQRVLRDYQEREYPGT